MSAPKRLAKRDGTGRNERPAVHVILDRNPPQLGPLLRRQGGQHLEANEQRKNAALLANGQSLGTVGGAGAGQQEEPGTKDSPSWEQPLPDLRPGSCLQGAWAGAPSELRHPSTKSPGAECGRGSTCHPSRAPPSAQGLGASNPSSSLLTWEPREPELKGQSPPFPSFSVCERKNHRNSGIQDSTASSLDADMPCNIRPREQPRTKAPLSASAGSDPSPALTVFPLPGSH